MISPDQFYDRVFKNFDNLHEKVDNYHKEDCKRIEKIQEQLNSLEKKVDVHLAVNTAVDNQENKTNEQKNHKIYWLIGIAGVINTILALFYN